MPTISTINLLNEYAAVFQKWGPPPVRWDRSRKKFVYRLNHKELLFWYFNVAVELFGTLCCGLICLREIFVKVTNVPTYVLIYVIFLGLMGSFVCVFSLLLLCGKEGTTAWDNICLIENIINTGNCINVKTCIDRTTREIESNEFFGGDDTDYMFFWGDRWSWIDL